MRIVKSFVTITVFVVMYQIVLLCVTSSNMNGFNHQDSFQLRYDMESVLSSDELFHQNMSSIVKVPSKSSTSTVPSLTTSTKILGFANSAYKEIAFRWYQEMSSLGYTNHYVIAADNETVTYFHEKNMRYDYLNTERKGWVWGKDTCSNMTSSMTQGKISQTSRRNMFASRWYYTMNQLKMGYHVFITDVDNLFQMYKPMSDFEQEEYDMVHAFSGDINSFPRNIYKVRGFNICGGLSWLRATPGVIDFVSDLVDRCGCKGTISSCNCFCDDQVAINSMYWNGEYMGVWNQKPHQKIVAKSMEEVYWDGFDGFCPKTGHKMRILDRNVAWRGTVHEGMTCPDNNWIAMPQGQTDKYRTRELWNLYCKTNVTVGT